MPQVKRKTPEQFVAQSPIGEKLSGVFERNLAAGALRLVEVNGQPQKHRKLGNKEAKTREVLESGYFGIINKNSEFVDAEINDLLIDEASVPQAYFDLQKKISRERGLGDVEFTDKKKKDIVERLRGDQRESLSEWSKYLRSDENGHVYPDWFKVYVWESLKKMGEFDEKRGKFKKRAKSTTAPWSELNAEALAYVWDKIDEGVIRGGSVDDEKLANLLNNGNFSTLYAHALHEAKAGAITPELREITEGNWVKYGQIEGSYSPNYQNENGEYTDDTPVDNDTAMSLAQSLRSWNTGWCTAGTRTAAHQLSKGDFYVYYTQDDQGDDTVPRVAVRMEGGRVAEVRGIDSGQNLEGNMVDVAAEKLKTLSGGDEYFEKVENMKRLTEIDERVKSGGEFTADDIKFLRFSGEIKGFGWNEDPRVQELLQDRDFNDDLGMVLVDKETDPTTLANKLIANGKDYQVVENLDKFLSAGADIDPAALVNELLEDRDYYTVAENIDMLRAVIDINPTTIVNKLIEGCGACYVVENLDKFLSAGADIDPAALANELSREGALFYVIENLDKFLSVGINIDLTATVNQQIEEGLYSEVASVLDRLIAAGAKINPTALANEIIKNDQPQIVESCSDKFIAAGVDREYLEKLLNIR